MKFNFRQIWQKILFFIHIDRLAWIFLIVGLVLNIILWLIWLVKTHYNILFIGFATGVLVTNIMLNFIFSNKEKIIGYFLLIIAIIVQILFLILLKNTLLIG